jgi:hypothetical protein
LKSFLPKLTRLQRASPTFWFTSSTSPCLGCSYLHILVPYTSCHFSGHGASPFPWHCLRQYFTMSVEVQSAIQNGTALNDEDEEISHDLNGAVGSGEDEDLFGDGGEDDDAGDE